MEKYKISSKDGYKLEVHIFEIEKAKAVVQIVHGMEEHQERYEDFAKFLNKEGYTVVSSDMRGHGYTVPKSDLGFFKKSKGYISLIEDQKAVTKFIKDKFPSLPVYLFAHSMGTIITRALLQSSSKDYSKVVLSGYPNYQGAASVGIMIADTVKLFKGAKYKSKLIQKLGVGVFNKAIKNPKTDVDWVCANEDTVRSYIEDPYCGFGFTCSAFSDLFHLVNMMHKEKLYHDVNKELPFLLIRGCDDPCTGGNDGAEDSRKVLKKAGFANLEHIDYPGMRHEILNEKDNKKVYKDVLDFYNKKIAQN